jgi:hypothetical protein
VTEPSRRHRVDASAVSAAPIDAVWTRPALGRFVPETARRLAAAAEADAGR